MSDEEAYQMARWLRRKKEKLWIQGQPPEIPSQVIQDFKLQWGEVEDWRIKSAWDALFALVKPRPNWFPHPPL